MWRSRALSAALLEHERTSIKISLGVVFAPGGNFVARTRRSILAARPPAVSYLCSGGWIAAGARVTNPSTVILVDSATRCVVPTTVAVNVACISRTS